MFSYIFSPCVRAFDPATSVDSRAVSTLLGEARVTGVLVPFVCLLLRSRAWKSGPDQEVSQVLGSAVGCKEAFLKGSSGRTGTS